MTLPLSPEAWWNRGLLCTSRENEEQRNWGLKVIEDETYKEIVLKEQPGRRDKGNKVTDGDQRIEAEFG